MIHVRQWKWCLRERDTISYFDLDGMQGYQLPVSLLRIHVARC